MSDCHISIKDMQMYYPSAIYNRKTLKQTVFELLRFQKPAGLLNDVHAIRGITLDINKGDKVGVIGHNGAGKSTLLKAISGIYPITSGSVEVEGNVRSLFDLSTGFEIEATGRENIMYRGLLLGETPSSLEKKVDSIIEFAELGPFIDYPIKSYSSGMVIRLAFAISTMVDGDILLLDEILGAGDARFMKKAKQRILDMVESTSILVLVSHDLASVRDLCNRVIWMEKGKIKMDGETASVTDAYYADMISGSRENVGGEVNEAQDN